MKKFTDVQLRNFGNKVDFKYLDNCEPDYDQCWEWTAYLDRANYGRFKINGKSERAHRIAYQMTHEDEILLGETAIYHTCKNHACVNPKHLYIRTLSDVEKCIFSDHDIRRFKEKIDFKYLENGELDINTCWLWKDSRITNDYGNFSINDNTYEPHRISYMIEKGKIPDGLFVCHECNSPGCVNPNHLRVDTPQGNVDDMVKAKRQSHKSCFLRLSINDIVVMLTKIHFGIYDTVKQISDDYLISVPSIRNILNGKYWEPETTIITKKLGVTLQDLHDKIIIKKKSLENVQVYQVKQLLKEGILSQTDIASQFNVSDAVISRIKRGKYK